MKFFVSVFLLILSPFSFVKIVLSTKCHQTVSPDEPHCFTELLQEFRQSNRLGYNQMSKLFACYRNAAKKEADPECYGWVNASCYTLTYELKDQTQYMIKHCDDAEHTYCPHTKETFDAEFTSTTYFFKTSHCDFCSSDNCNDQIPRDKPMLIEPPPPGMGADIKCHYSGYNCLEYVNQTKIIECLRNATKEERSGPCPLSSTACVKMNIKFKDVEQLVLKACTIPETFSICEEMKVFAKVYQVTVECEICKTDFCNGETLIKVKHGGLSHSRETSTAPLSYGILIFNLLVHFLL